MSGQLKEYLLQGVFYFVVGGFGATYIYKQYEPDFAGGTAGNSR